MWTELRYCKERDLIRAYFLGDTDIENPNNCNWHMIYTLREQSNGKYYVAIEGFKGCELSGLSDVYVKE